MANDYFEKADQALRTAAIRAALRAKEFGHGLIVTDAEGSVQEVDPEKLLSTEGLNSEQEIPRQIAK
ncbi:MAG: hypothetical protein KC994_23980 [Candidatus Omnitrophica bacterium]|nr:hypothetical protein [Candidatus Omnitrophota bacterium]